MTTTKTPPTEILSRAIRAKHPLIAISSYEEARVEAAVKSVCEKDGENTRLLFVWSSATGLRQIAGEQVENAPAPDETKDPDAMLGVIFTADQFCSGKRAVFLIKDLHGFMSGSPTVVRALRDIGRLFTKKSYTAILISPNFNVPAELEKETTLIDWPLPNADELEAIIKSATANAPKNLPCKLGADEIARLRQAMIGLTAVEATNVLSMAMVTFKSFDSRAIALVLAEKKAIVRKSGYLEFYEADVSYSDIGGSAKLKEYNRQVRAAFSPDAEAFGLPNPRGVLLVGVPGAGKSLMAKAATNGEVPLLRLDIGALMGGLVGQSEGNTRAALKLAEALGNCVLWIDEIDKGMSGMGGGDSDGGTTRRVLGTMLTWMQEQNTGAYVFATANDIGYIVRTMPELLRRFDDIWWVDLPNSRERAEIASIHLAKRKRDPGKFDLAAIARATKGFTGAEIEKAVASAMRAAFANGRDIDTDSIIDAAKSLVPVSRQMGEKLTALRSWARSSARWASEPDEVQAIGSDDERQIEL